MLVSLLMLFSVTVFSQEKKDSVIIKKLETQTALTLSDLEQQGAIFYTKFDSDGDGTYEVYQLPYGTLEENVNLFRTEFGNVSREDSVAVLKGLSIYTDSTVTDNEFRIYPTKNNRYLFTDFGLFLSSNKAGLDKNTIALMHSSGNITNRLYAAPSATSNPSLNLDNRLATGQDDYIGRIIAQSATNSKGGITFINDSINHGAAINFHTSNNWQNLTDFTLSIKHDKVNINNYKFFDSWANAYTDNQKGLGVNGMVLLDSTFIQSNPHTKNSFIRSLWSGGGFLETYLIRKQSNNPRGKVTAYYVDTVFANSPYSLGVNNHTYHISRTNSDLPFNYPPLSLNALKTEYPDLILESHSVFGSELKTLTATKQTIQVTTVNKKGDTYAILTPAEFNELKSTLKGSVPNGFRFLLDINNDGVGDVLLFNDGFEFRKIEHVQYTGGLVSPN